jgi:hypothetical protein
VTKTSITPEDVLDSTSSEVKKIISEIITIEKEYHHYQNLSNVKEKEKELCARIKKTIEKRISQ